MKLTNDLERLTAYPFHMPGHKRNDAFGITASNIDITEIDGFDNLHNSKGVLKQLEDDIAILYGSKKSFISVNGSTCGILASISAVCNRNDKIIIARNCHKSVYNACLLNELRIIYVEPEFNKSIGVFTNVTQKSIDNALLTNPDAKAIVITSPTYEGIVSSIKADIPVIVDSAHGSHFGFADYLPDRATADIVINSLHKTLPALTQSAAVHIYNEKYISSVKKYIDIFETSSPSYILLSSIDRCVDFLKNCNDSFNKYKKLLDDFYTKTSKLKNIKLFNNDDITRLIITADGYSGENLAQYLRDNNIEVEGYGIKYVILISTVCDTQKGFDMLFSALKNIKAKQSNVKSFNKPPLPIKRFEQYEISDTIITPLNNAVGKVAAESIFAYPPDVPLITAGEVFSKEIIDYISDLMSMGVNILSDSNLLPNSVLTNKE